MRRSLAGALLALMLAAALAACYRSCLELAREHRIDSVDFPSISTGV